MMDYTEVLRLIEADAGRVLAMQDTAVYGNCLRFILVTAKSAIDAQPHRSLVKIDDDLIAALMAERRAALEAIHDGKGQAAEIARMRQDAERYRWLRECSTLRSDRTMYVIRNVYLRGTFIREENPVAAELDAIIDAARAAEGGTT
jgi:hypothetical protein